ncbi:hypothetical protein DL237_11230 [Pseudooceanicola sediminis]|uniref:Outer membrane protein beta-barrel domain-containing protein n=1 Tax=Pseudooceanicola sediminis TaxID=2211117 RepID=A0A399J3G6_9RHOB|nr:hypothetical protein [Pseudooceanicola sediminis]KAA2313711.1 hypothetical protein E0K93_13805 [Puniceibacterium sp. HSS470]RII38452.1 hypothetical protein DL237_11230 [Pseudooceanicola sediminis]|tara:strand:- start:129768 stop:130397 length:630 start_codon:yes stop_codon:yes gene_type:complete
MKTTICAATLATLIGATAAQAQDAALTLDAGLSTLGVFVQPVYALNDRVSLRAPIYYGAFSDTFEFDDNSVDGELKALSAALAANFFPMGTGFFLSGGVAFGGYEANGSTDEITANGSTYTGDFGVSLKQKKTVAPQLSMGFRQKNKGGMTASFEIGARFASYEMSISGAEQLSPQGQSDVADEVAKTNRDLDDYDVIPFLGLSVGWAF